ncbi:MAG: type II toxin-antitoxin system VapC family toxin [bacterium]
MILYAESSAVLSWLLGESPGANVAQLLRDAQIVVTSELTLIECDRVFNRALASSLIDEPEIERRRTIMSQASAHWHHSRIAAGVVERARQPFPVEPVRSLDAIHLASALEARSAMPALALLSLDRRVRSNGRALGIPLLPR